MASPPLYLCRWPLLSASTSAFLINSQSGLSAKVGDVYVSSQSRSPPSHCLTMVCIPLPAGVIDLSSTDFIFQSSDLTSTQPTTHPLRFAPLTELAYFDDMHRLHSTTALLLNLQLAPELVEEVLGRISNGSVVALAF